MENVIKRDVFNDLKNHFSKKEITLIIGPRQVGKTTLMNLLREDIQKQGEKTLYLSLDFENDNKFFISQEILIERLKLEFGDNRGYVFIDEIQRKEDAGLFLKGIYDRNMPYKFIISGSGSVELKEKVHESLAGRKMIFEIEPVSFTEFVSFKTEYKYEERLDSYFNLEKEKTAIFLEEYFNFGGYPRVVLEKTKEDKLKAISEIYRSFIEKDISYLLKVEKLDAFNSLVKALASQTGKILNYSEIANTCGISLKTVKNYLWYLEKIFVIQIIYPYFRNKRKEITKSPTVYFYDLGLRNYAIGAFGNLTNPNDTGFLFQNLTFNILKEKLKWSGAQINFWRTKDKAEVNFVVNFGERLIPIEVKYKNFKEPSAERAFTAFIKKYSPETGFVITRNFKGELIIEKTKVCFIPFFELKTTKL